MPEEMILLRNALTARDIPWENMSYNLDRSFPFLNLIVYRTVYDHNNHHWVVKSGYGTFGGDDGLLELEIDGDLPKGRLKAVDILNLLDTDF